MTNDEFAVFAKQVADIGSAFYFHPDTLATGKASGLDGFRFYFVGRGGVLGDVEADVVHSAFGYFEPALFATMWNSAKEIIPARDGARRTWAAITRWVGRSSPMSRASTRSARRPVP